MEAIVNQGENGPEINKITTIRLKESVYLVRVTTPVPFSEYFLSQSDSENQVIGIVQHGLTSIILEPENDEERQLFIAPIQAEAKHEERELQILYAPTPSPSTEFAILRRNPQRTLAAGNEIAREEMDDDEERFEMPMTLADPRFCN